MTKHHIHIGVEEADRGYERFIEAWHQAEAGELERAEVHLNFEDLAMLAAVLTPTRLELMKTLRQHGPLSVRALAKHLDRDYKNVHADVTALAEVDLVQRTDKKLLVAPWDVIDAHIRLVDSDLYDIYHAIPFDAEAIRTVTMILKATFNAYCRVRGTTAFRFIQLRMSFLREQARHPPRCQFCRKR